MKPNFETVAPDLGLLDRLRSNQPAPLGASIGDVLTADGTEQLDSTTVDGTQLCGEPPDSNYDLSQWKGPDPNNPSSNATIIMMISYHPPDTPKN